jgi:hypothetical protein
MIKEHKIYTEFCQSSIYSLVCPLNQTFFHPIFSHKFHRPNIDSYHSITHILLLESVRRNMATDRKYEVRLPIKYMSELFNLF